MAYSDSSPGTTAAELAAVMHAESVDLWNRLWSEAGEDMAFPEREAVETLQRILTDLAYSPKACP